MSRFIRPWTDLRTLRRLVHYLRRVRPRLIHTCTPKAGLLGPLAARIVGIPAVHSVFGLLFHDRAQSSRNAAYRMSERLTASCVSHLLFQSREDLEIVRALGWKPAEHLHYLGNGIDVQRFDPERFGAQRKVLRHQLGYRDHHFVIGIVARLLWTKGLGEFLKAAEQLRHRTDLRFLIVGPAETGHPQAVPETIMRRVELQGNVQFAGEQSDVPRFYAAMDLFALPSYREGIPRSLLEASAMELPVITTDIRGCREAVSHGQTGWLVPPREAKSLADRIEYCAAHAAEAREWGQAGRRRVLQLFDEALVHQRLLAFYDEMLGPCGPAREGSLASLQQVARSPL